MQEDSAEWLYQHVRCKRRKKWKYSMISKKKTSEKKESNSDNFIPHPISFAVDDFHFLGSAIDWKRWVSTQITEIDSNRRFCVDTLPIIIRIEYQKCVNWRVNKCCRNTGVDLRTWFYLDYCLAFQRTDCSRIMLSVQSLTSCIGSGSQKFAW